MPIPPPVNASLRDLPTYQPGRPIEEVARELGLPASDIIKLASNENPLGPSPAALAAMQKVWPISISIRTEMPLPEKKRRKNSPCRRI
jgi:histidinol-phosphate aminotransferase